MHEFLKSADLLLRLWTRLADECTKQFLLTAASTPRRGAKASREIRRLSRKDFRRCALQVVHPIEVGCPIACKLSELSFATQRRCWPDGWRADRSASSGCGERRPCWNSNGDQGESDDQEAG